MKSRQQITVEFFHEQLKTMTPIKARLRTRLTYSYFGVSNVYRWIEPEMSKLKVLGVDTSK